MRDRLTIRTRYGLISAPNTEDTISRFLMYCGEWAWDEVRFVASVLSDGARVLDIGAYLGTFGLGLALNRHLAFVCFVEANKEILPLLQSNSVTNGNLQSSVINAMVAGESITPRRGWSDPANLGATSFNEVPCVGLPIDPPDRTVTLADLRTEYGSFDLIKLDVEGMELNILQGDRDYLRTGASSIWVECNERPQSLDLAEELLSWGFEMYYFAFPSHNPSNFCGAQEPIYPGAYEAGLLVGPKSQPLLDPEMKAHHCILHCIRTVGDLKEAMWRTPRWLPAELAHADVSELAAAAGRALIGQSRETFLAARSHATGSAPDRTFWERLAETEAELLRAQALALERTEQLEVERDRRHAADQRLANITASHLTRLSEVGDARERAELARAQAEAQIQVVQTRLESVQRARTQAESELLSMHTYLRQSESARTEAEMQLRSARTAVQDTSREIAAIKGTLVWRLASPIMAFVSSRPRLLAVLRRSRIAVSTALRWVRRAIGTIVGKRR